MSAPNATATPQEDYITTKQFAQLLKTNEKVITASRSSGILFSRKPPEHIRLGERKLLYALSDVIAWINDFPKSTVTTNSEPSHLSSHRERELCP